MLTDRIFEYPVDANHSLVLGYGATSNFGAHLWDTLDWHEAYSDNGQHILNPDGGEYLHVRVKYDQAQGDGWKLSQRRQYRVQCRHFIGSKWRGGIVRDVKVLERDRHWIWQVHVDR